MPGSEPSGAALGTAPVNGIAAPWDDQPAQGFSGVLPNTDGTCHVLSDNGYGNKANSGRNTTGPDSPPPRSGNRPLPAP